MRQPDSHRQADRLAHFIAEHERLVDRFLLTHAANQHAKDATAQRITLIAHSPESAAARVLFDTRFLQIREAGFELRVILGDLEPNDRLAHMLAALDQLNNGVHLTACVRHAKNPCLLDAHEQMVLGGSSVWSGDSLRRAGQLKDHIQLVSENATREARLAGLSFRSIWAASCPLREATLRTAGAMELADQAAGAGLSMLAGLPSPSDAPLPAKRGPAGSSATF